LPEKLQFPVGSVILRMLHIHLQHHSFRKDEKGKICKTVDNQRALDIKVLASCTELSVTDSRQEVVLYVGVWEESSQCMNVKMRALRKVTRSLRLDRFF